MHEKRLQINVVFFAYSQPKCFNGEVRGDG
nr:MAG TPA: hypothetical protein [Caudoviricetes sp.]